MREELKLNEAKEKFGELNVREIFKIQIEEKLYPVYSIEGYTHELGRANGCPDSWWLEYSEKGEDDEEDRERSLIPYIDKGANRICWGFNFSQRNYMKYKWDEWDLRSSGKCEIYANGKLIYSFGCRDIEYAASKAVVLQSELLEHPYDFINPESEINRKIWYYGLPATIMPSDYMPGEIEIYPDYSYIEKEEWWQLLNMKKEKIRAKPDEDDFIFDQMGTRADTFINHGDALWDKMIDWFRS